MVSGEGLIYHVRDAVVTKDGKTTDAGVDDKRLLVVETEMSRVLKAMNRDSCTLSDVIRQAWDGGHLRTLARHNPLRATGAHLGIIAHATRADITRHLTETDAANGFGNRLLWMAVRRSQLLPDGVPLDCVPWASALHRLREARAVAARADVLRRDPDATALWREVYEELGAGRPGLLGAILSRAEAQTMRLACVYALLDATDWIRVEHLAAALAVWKYCEDSARLIFGEALGDPDAEKLLAALRAAPAGLTRKAIYSEVFGRHRKAAVIARLLSDLLTSGLIHREAEPSAGGRPPERWHAGRGGRDAH
jgi:hypothetical protein